MTTKEPDADWQLKLRYGKASTKFQHYTTISDGVVGDLVDGFACQRGPAFMGMKAWASSADEAIDMAHSIGRQIGFRITGRVQVYKTDPVQPPEDKPFGYDINFTPFAKE